ncbi:MAG: hypothetical protein RL497_2327 [Pseudomonadota bacterium]|jgi:hypothetical protein
MRRFYLYSTLGCHLCEEAEAVLLPLLAHGGSEIEIIDIAEENLIERYGTRIPVLLNPSTGAELDWPFDAQLLQQWFLSPA